MVSSHRRNLGPMLASLRCGARTRRGTLCRAPAVFGKRRCRMHGGAKGSGAPKGNRNALKHGGFTKEALAELAELRRLIAEVKNLVSEQERHPTFFGAKKPQKRFV
jgi:hypothetical protein